MPLTKEEGRTLLKLLEGERGQELLKYAIEVLREEFKLKTAEELKEKKAKKQKVEETKVDDEKEEEDFSLTQKE